MSDKNRIRIRPGITLLPELIEKGKKIAARKGISFSRWLENLIKRQKL